MYPLPGHLSVSFLLGKLFRLSIPIVILAGFFPDIFDKPLCYLFGIFPFGRTVMHSIPGVLLMVIVLYFWKGKNWAASWGVGHTGHLMADYIGGMIARGYSFVPWFFPLKHYEFPKVHFVFSPREFFIEIFLGMICLLLMLREKKRNISLQKNRKFNL